MSDEMVKTTYRIDSRTHESLVLLADLSGKSVNQYVWDLLSEHVESKRGTDEFRAHAERRIREMSERLGIEL